MKRVFLGGMYGFKGGRSLLIDDEDYYLISKHNWTADKHNRENGPELFYARTTIAGKKVYAHALIAGQHVDHINHNGLDNRRKNLRTATRGEQLANTRQRSGKSSAYKGVAKLTTPTNGRQWMARIAIDGRQVYIGLFDTEEDAGRAYDTKARALPDAKFRTYNFPRRGERSALS